MQLTLSFRHKLIVVGLIVAAGCAAQVWLSHAAMTSMVEAAAELRRNFSASNSAMDLQLRLGAMEQAVVGVDAENYPQVRDDLVADIGRIQAMLQAAEPGSAGEFASAWQELRELLTYYEPALFEWYDGILALGLERDRGRRAELAAAEAAVETAIGAYSSILANFAAAAQQTRNFQIEPTAINLALQRRAYGRFVDYLRRIDFYRSFAEPLERYEAVVESYADLAMDLGLRREIMVDYRQQMQDRAQALTELIASEGIAQAEQQTETTASFGQITVLAGGIGLGLLAVAVLGLTGWRVRSDLNRSILAIRAVAGGNLKRRLAVNSARNDEFDHLAAAVNTMADDLRTMVTHVNEANIELTGLSGGLRSTVEAMAARNGSVAAQTQALAMAGQEMSRAIAEVAASSGELSNTADRTLRSSQEGHDVSARAATALESIAAIVVGASEQMNALAERSANIDRVVDVINALAQQTNLLALNAAIEAARAGDAGRGFSVVAEEVRNLAERTVGATAEIAGIVEGIRAETTQMRSIMADGEQHVSEGTRLGQRLADAMDAIHLQAELASAATTQIAGAVETVSTTIRDMSSKLDRSAAELEQNRLATDELVGSSRHLAEKSTDLQTLTGKFQTA